MSLKTKQTFTICTKLNVLKLQNACNLYIVALKKKGLKPIFFILRKQQKNNWQSDNFSTIGHKLTVLGYKRGNLTSLKNV